MQNMATTAKSSSSTSPSNVRNFTEGQEDIETIAKQISDHAEAIYQTWKARGLAPTEILNCHTDASPFKSALSPTDPGKVTELLAQAPDLSNNNLEKLVSSFVNEDKARIAAQRRQLSPTSGGSSIAHVLQKFERSSSEPPSTSRPNFIRQSSQPPPSTSSSSSNGLHHNSNGAGGSNNVPDVLKDTIEQKVASPRQKPQTPAKPEHLLNHVPSWPLKNRVITNNHTSPSAGSNGSNTQQPDQSSSDMVKQKHVSPVKKSSLSGSTKNATQLLDEVTREEERLINALKTGTVLNSDSVSVLPEVITSTLNDSTTTITTTKDYQQRTSTTTTNSHSNNIMSKAKSDAVATNENGGSGGGGPVMKLFNGVPAKPNHTPMFNVQVNNNNSKDDKPFSLVGKVATTRIPLRPQLRDLEEAKNFVAKNTPQPVRPFLSRGSVAERVLIFEKAPPERQPERRSSLKEPAKLNKPIVVSRTIQLI